MAENDAASLKQERPTIEPSTEDVITPKEVTDETASKEPVSIDIDATLDTVPIGENADEPNGTDTIHVTSESVVLAAAEPVKEGPETIIDIESETIKQEEPVYSGLLSYKKASATFPYVLAMGFIPTILMSIAFTTRDTFISRMKPFPWTACMSSTRNTRNSRSTRTSWIT